MSIVTGIKTKRFNRNAAIAQILHEAEMYLDDARSGGEHARARLLSLSELCGFAATDSASVSLSMIYVALEAILPMHANSTLRVLVDHVTNVRETWLAAA